MRSFYLLIAFSIATVALAPSLLQDDVAQAAPAPPVKEKDAITPKVWKYQESRGELHSDNKNGWMNEDATLTLMLNPDKSEGTAISYALDSNFGVKADIGEDLLKDNQWGEEDDAGLTWIRAGNHHEGPVEGQLQMELDIKSPKRAAKFLSADGKVHVKFGIGIEEKHLKKVQDSKPNSDLFKSDDGTIRIEFISFKEQEVTIKIHGSSSRLMNFAVVDGKGEELWGSSSTSILEGYEERSYSMSKEDSKDFGFKFKIAKKIVRKALDIALENYKLP